MILVKKVTSTDNLEQIVDEINQSSWDDANDMGPYDVASLRTYVAGEGYVFVTCHETSSDRSTFLGMASARLATKPYAGERWLYVDEVDVCADQREKGAGKLMMETLIEFAKANGCREMWLGTEPDNAPANALYRSLQPDEVAQFIGYTFEIDPD